MRIRKAVFPVGGLGTRFLPATKASPKEMLPIIDKPLIQFAVEEAAEAGATEMIFVTGRGKRAIEDHFDKAYELEAELSARGREDLLEQAREMMPTGISFHYVRQKEALGLGHAILCAREMVGQEPFLVLLADDLMVCEPNASAQLVSACSYHGCSAMAAAMVDAASASSFGMFDAERIGDKGKSWLVKSVVEKPARGQEPSLLASLGRYALTPDVFDWLARAKPGRGGEIQLSEAISAMASQRQVVAVEVGGERFDCGSKLGYFKAQVAFGLRHGEIGKEAKAWLESLGKEAS